MKYKVISWSDERCMTSLGFCFYFSCRASAIVPVRKFSSWWSRRLDILPLSNVSIPYHQLMYSRINSSFDICFIYNTFSIANIFLAWVALIFLVFHSPEDGFLFETVGLNRIWHHSCRCLLLEMVIGLYYFHIFALVQQSVFISFHLHLSRNVQVHNTLL